MKASFRSVMWRDSILKALMHSCIYRYRNLLNSLLLTNLMMSVVCEFFITFISLLAVEVVLTGDMSTARILSPL